MSCAAALAKTSLLVHSPAKLLNRLKEPARSRMEKRLEAADDMLAASAALKSASLMAAAALVVVWAARHEGTAFWGSLALAWLAVVLLTEIIPPAVSGRHSETIVQRTAPLLSALTAALRYPVVLPLRKLVRLLTGRLGGPLAPPADREELADEIRAAVEDSDHTDSLAEEEKEWIENIVELRDIDVAEAMTPRTDVVAVEASLPLHEALRSVAHSGHSRFPVYEGRLDSVVGILYLKDAVPRLFDGRARPEEITVRSVMRPPYFVPESKRIADLLREFRTQRIQVAVVLDEYGGTAGMITIEDILEEIVGEIDSEHDRAGEGTLVRAENGTAEVDARIRVAEVNEELDLSLPEGDDYDTLGGFVLSRLGRIPRPGERFEAEGVEITVLKADARRIGRLRLRLPSPEATKLPS